MRVLQLKMIELNIDFGFFLDMYHVDTSNMTVESLKEPLRKAANYVLENFGKDHPLYNPQKRQDRLDADAAAERGEPIPTCPNCGGHQIQAVIDSFPFGTVWRVCLACGHKFK
jgi:hypothetical protein